MNFQERLERRMFYSYAGESDAGRALSAYLGMHFKHFDGDAWRERILCGDVLVNGKAAAPGTVLKRHDRIVFFPGDAPEPEAELHFRVVYEDGDLLVFDKPGDLCVHPTGPFFRHTLWHLAGSIYGELRFVNRLDRETSGLLVAVRSRRAAALMNNHSCPVRKEYLALVFGRFRGNIRARGCLSHDAGSAVFKKKRFVSRAFKDSFPQGRLPAVADGEYADTELREEGAVGTDMTLVRAIPHTGRQHQIRATLFSLGFPLVGDKLYGPDERLFLKIRERTISEEDYARLRMRRQALHSAVLVFRHPVSGAEIKCGSPLPADFPRA